MTADPWAEEQDDRARDWARETVECPNELDPVLRKVHDGVFIPEAGCPKHDVENLADICDCGHTRAGHHRLCNGKVGKFWCHCRTFSKRVAR